VISINQHHLIMLQSIEKTILSQECQNCVDVVYMAFTKHSHIVFRTNIRIVLSWNS
jgi:hypothetical protein